MADARSPDALELQRCCGAKRWVQGMLARRPFDSLGALHAAADAVWAEMTRDDYLEAFAHHPQIGENLAALREKFASTASWATSEQAGTAGANEDTLLALRDGNAAYHARFGYSFIVCATGKSAEEMLSLLRARLGNTPEHELGIAAAEQSKITHLRLEKLAS